MSIKISQFTIESYDRVYSLWKQCQGVGLGDSDSKDNISLFINRNPGTSYIAETDGELVGAVLAGHDGRRGYMHHLAVSSDFRRQGIGKALVDHCLKGLKEYGISKCHLFLFNNNYSGKEFWNSAGWSHRDDICVVSKFINSSKREINQHLTIG
jgi:N-acetylglutamate synthase